MSRLYCLLFALVAFSSFLRPVGVLNDTAVFNMDIDAGNWDVIIRDVNEAEFAALYGTSYESVHDYLVSTNTYINAIAKTGRREMTVRKTGVDTDSDGSVENIISLSSSEKKKFAERAAAIFEQQGGKSGFSGIFRHPQTDFLVYDMTYKSGEPDEYYGIRYFTVVNGINIYIDYYNYEEKITADERDEFQSVIDSIYFNDVETRSGMPVGRIVILCAAGAAVGALLSALIIKAAGKAKKKLPAASPEDEETGENTDNDGEEEAGEDGEEDPGEDGEEDPGEDAEKSPDIG